MRLSLGTPMVRIDDGRRGVVENVNGELRIVHEDRGERLIASKLEKWAEAEPKQGPLRDEEKRLVALTADRQLRSIIMHEPMAWWKPIDPDAEPFDEKLVRVIVEHLGAR